jgi:hypothetical protein
MRHIPDQSLIKKLEEFTVHYELYAFEMHIKEGDQDLKGWRNKGYISTKRISYL